MKTFSLAAVAAVVCTSNFAQAAQPAPLSACQLIIETFAINKEILGQNLEILINEMQTIRFRSQKAERGNEVLRYEPGTSNYELLKSSPEVKHQEIAPGIVFFQRPGYRLKFQAVSKEQLANAHKKASEVVLALNKIPIDSDIAWATVDQIACD